MYFHVSPLNLKKNPLLTLTVRKFHLRSLWYAWCRHSFHLISWGILLLLQLLLTFWWSWSTNWSLITCPVFSLVQFPSKGWCSRSTLVKSFAHLWIFKDMFLIVPFCSSSYLFELVIIFNSLSNFFAILCSFVTVLYTLAWSTSHSWSFSLVTPSKNNGGLSSGLDA